VHNLQQDVMFIFIGSLSSSIPEILFPLSGDPVRLNKIVHKIGFVVFSVTLMGLLNSADLKFVYASPMSGWFENIPISNAIVIGKVNILINHPPNCAGAFPSSSELKPPDHKMVPVTISGLIDPDRDQITVQVTRILQDELVTGLARGDLAPDGMGIGTEKVQLRSERSDSGDGRVYHIFFRASDGKLNGNCERQILVSVPHDSAHKAIDSGALYDSTTSSNNIAINLGLNSSQIHR